MLLEERDAQNKRLSSENERLSSEITRLTEELAAERSRPMITNNNTTNNTTNVHVNLVAYGEEALPPWEEVLRVLRPANRSISRYLELKHFGQPSTSNLRITNRRGASMQVVEEAPDGRKRWGERDKKRTLDELAQTGLSELEDHYEAHKKVQVWNAWYRGNKMDQAGYDETDEWKRQRREVENMILSQRPTNLLHDSCDSD